MSSVVVLRYPYGYGRMSPAIEWSPSNKTLARYRAQQQQQQHDACQLHHQLQHLIGSTARDRAPDNQTLHFSSCMYPLSPAQSSPLPSSPATGMRSPIRHSLPVSRVMSLKENDPSPHSAVPGALSKSVTKTSASHCKRRLDFNHNVHDNSEFDLTSSHHSLPTTAISNGYNLTFGPNVHCQQISDLTVLKTEIHDSQEAEPDTMGHVPAVARRNERERNRVKLINMTFATLREHLPQNASKSGKARKMSKVETLRAAIDYIHQLQALLKGRQSNGPESADAAAAGEGSVDGAQEDDVSDHVDAVLRAAGVRIDLTVVSCLSATLAANRASAASFSPATSPTSSSRSPALDDCCSNYEHLSADEEELLDIADWF